MLTRRRALVAGLVVYAGLLALALLWPTSGQQSAWVAEARGLLARLGTDPGLVTQARGEFIANALILAPVSAIGSLLWRRTTWRDWTAIAFVLATLVELGQGAFLPDRTPAYADVVANTLGGLGGAAVVALARLATRERREELH